MRDEWIDALKRGCKRHYQDESSDEEDDEDEEEEEENDEVDAVSDISKESFDIIFKVWML